MLNNYNQILHGGSRKYATLKKHKPPNTQAPMRTKITRIKEHIEMYSDHFDKIGLMPRSVKLSVNKNMQPHIDPPRKTPISLKDTIKQELDKMGKKNQQYHQKSDRTNRLGFKLSLLTQKGSAKT